MVVMFSKFLPGQRDSQLLLDSDNFTYSRKKDKDTPLNTAWKCSKNRSLKCHAMVFLDTNNALSQGSKPHNHAPDNLIEEKSTFFSSLKRKAADQRITATQNIMSEVLEGASKDLYMQRGADMTYLGMHVPILPTAAPLAPTTAPLAPTAAPLTPTTAPLYI